MINKTTLLAIAVGLMIISSSCIPSHLQKYRKNNSAGSTNSASSDSMLHPGADMNSPMMPGSSTKYSSSKYSTKKEAAKQRMASIYAVDKNTYRFRIREDSVWESALSVLMRNYNLTIVNRQNGIITTEWDSYYLNSSVYRNKVSIRIRRVAWNAVDFQIHNNVEKLRDASQAAGTVGAVWLPAKDVAGELDRIIKNMAAVLNQPPPIMPPGTAVAKDVNDKDSNIQ